MSAWIHGFLIPFSHGVVVGILRGVAWPLNLHFTLVFTVMGLSSLVRIIPAQEAGDVTEVLYRFRLMKLNFLLLALLLLHGSAQSGLIDRFGLGGVWVFAWLTSLLLVVVLWAAHKIKSKQKARAIRRQQEVETLPPWRRTF